ncbi:hypothetical protein TSUD_301550 [Trifolium subterraneum]|uniref:Uncharacterized protein n=1 Tax=Trifolium subterraneum TaxID=3900 RepID=A0A2Z6PFY3_TRISU|nr:hypothetical protein TSUD_301550 [Trifolium subterraneum]
MKYYMISVVVLLRSYMEFSLMSQGSCRLTVVLRDKMFCCIDQLETRMKAVNLVGDIIALPGISTSEAFQPILSEFLKRLTDIDFGVRMSVLVHIKSSLLSNPQRPEAPEIICESINYVNQIQSQFLILNLLLYILYISDKAEAAALCADVAKAEGRTQNLETKIEEFSRRMLALESGSCSGHSRSSHPHYDDELDDQSVDDEEDD